MLNMKELPDSMRPYERCMEFGPSVLTDTELLAIILQSGTKEESVMELSNRVLSHYEDGLLGICNATSKELMAVKGIGKVKAMKLLTVGELARRISKSGSRKQLIMSDAATIANYYMEETKILKKEQVIIMYLDAKCSLIRDQVLSVGTVRASVVSPREVFLGALQFGAVYIIMLHNHPSGDPTPSTEDIEVTDRIKNSGALLGITLLDHIVLGMNQYYSFLEHHIL